MSIYYLQAQCVKILKHDDSNDWDVLLIRDVGELNRWSTYYSIQIPDDVKLHTRAVDSVSAKRLAKASDVRELNFELLLFQISPQIDNFALDSEAPVNRLNVKNIKDAIWESTVDTLIAGYRFVSDLRDDSSVILNKEGKPFSTLGIHYDHSTGQFSIDEVVNGRLNDNLLADYDDPLLTEDDIPELLNYVKEILKSKKYSII